jgi:hypothetical protein
MSVPMIAYHRTRYAENLLDACRAWEKIWNPDATPQAVAEYLSRLHWNYEGCVARQGPTWTLDLDGQGIAWYAGPKCWRPALAADMKPCFNAIPVDYEYVVTPAQEG